MTLIPLYFPRVFINLHIQGEVQGAASEEEGQRKFWADILLLPTTSRCEGRSKHRLRILPVGSCQDEEEVAECQ